MHTCADCFKAVTVGKRKCDELEKNQCGRKGTKEYADMQYGHSNLSDVCQVVTGEELADEGGVF